MAGSAARFDRWYRRLVIGIPYLWFVIFLVVPFLIVLRIGAVADRARAAAL